MLTAIALASCASSLSNKASAPANLAALPEQAPNVDSATPAKAAIPRPQLIKSADISIQVKSIEDTTKAISDLVKQQQGDILELQDFRTGSYGIAQSVSLKLRIPQERLDSVLETIAQLGI
jgi:hypothetical protein